MSDKTLSQLNQELLELQITAIISKHTELAIKRGVTFGEIIYSQRNTAKKVIAFLREHMV